MTYHKCGCTTDPFGTYIDECERVKFMRSQCWDAFSTGSPERAKAMQIEINEHKEVY